MDLARHGARAAPGPVGLARRPAGRDPARRPAAYDGRATKDENWFERTPASRRKGNGPGLEQDNEAPASVALPRRRPLPDGGFRIYYEWPLPDSSHELLEARAGWSTSTSGGPRRGTGAEWMIDVVVSPCEREAVEQVLELVDRAQVGLSR